MSATVATAPTTMNMFATTAAAFSHVDLVIGHPWMLRGVGVDRVRWQRSGSSGDESRLSGLLELAGAHGFFAEQVVVSVDEGQEHQKEGQLTLEDGVLRVDAADELVNEGALTHMLIAVYKRIGELLQSLAVRMCRKLTLAEAMELGLQIHGVAGLVAGEEITEINLDDARHRRSVGLTFQLHAHVEEILRDGGVDPAADSQILTRPIGIITMGGVVIDVREKTEAAKHNQEESAPLGIVVRQEIKSCRERRL